MSEAEHQTTIRIVSISDSESYLKWACALLDGLPGVDAQVCLVDNPILPTPEQIAHAVAGTAWQGRRIPVISRAEVAATIAAHRADVVLAAATGPVVAQIFASAHGISPRPALVSGLPGVGLPARSKGMRYRRLGDAFIAHSHFEVSEYERISAKVRVPTEVLLGRLPMLRSEGIPRPIGSATVDFAPADSSSAVPGRLVFATQAKVPVELSDRIAIVRALARFAEAHPQSRAIVKVRSRPGEQETHHEQHPYHEILDRLRRERVPGADRLELGYGPMSDFLTEDAALVTVSSTAALEAIDRGLPTAFLSDFGFTEDLLNEVFADSGATATLADVAAGRIPFPAEDWLAANYFHPENTGLRRRLGLLALRARERQLPDMRRALWQQKRMLARAELRTLAPDVVVRSYRTIRYGRRPVG
ncbi:hypothetical protein DFO66_101466 [Brevibacterium sanguinis]|uniref:Uncharacterized protein n=2 Tax=Brevibacterium TaxID=1696 RepID=A0A366IQ02_9MICO|nr:MULTISPECIES: DUF6716 putative glycosyltransferase [Brevibacterium]RBP68237.1 hypothetical protein DFO66_101466 [Brevibacterium sanguinis]RBP74346.1 hypothetical protein DFO65_10163 [Brevibacterium celere]